MRWFFRITLPSFFSYILYLIIISFMRYAYGPNVYALVELHGCTRDEFPEMHHVYEEIIYIFPSLKWAEEAFAWWSDGNDNLYVIRKFELQGSYKRSNKPTKFDHNSKYSREKYKRLYENS